MNEQELKELFKELEKRGWEPQLCDTAVPYFENMVMCGEPNGVGDVVAEQMMMPKSFLSLQPEFFVKAQGDSMIGADIMEGDMVKVETNAAWHDGDIVLVMIDDEFTLKTYCEDDNGTAWLVPQNPKYKAFPLNPSQYNVRVVGKVTMLMRNAPRTKYSTCKRLINEAKAKMGGPKETSQNKSENDIELRFRYALDVLKEEGLLKHLYDYTWVLEVANHTKGMPHFYTPKSFITYLKDLGLERLPSNDSIQVKQSKFNGDFPNWEFIDCDATEANRRINVGKRFLTAFRSK